MIGWWYWLQKCKRLLENKVKGLVEVVEKDINTIINELVARNKVSQQRKTAVGHKRKSVMKGKQTIVVGC